MPAPQRRTVPGVIARLASAPYRFQLTQAVRVLLIWLRRAGISPGVALRDVLRFRNTLSLGFPPSEIASLSIDRANEPDDDAPISPRTLLNIQITPAFMGLLGVHGTLPRHYTERVAAAEHAGQDGSAHAFLDLLSDRPTSLFFEAWCKYRHELDIDVHGEDRFRPMLLSLGPRPVASPPPGGGRPALHTDVMAFYAGLLRQKPMSMAALRCVLADYFDIPLAIEQFTGGWDDIADNRQCRMGGANATIGCGGALGVRTWRHDLRITLHIGPLGKTDFERFLPGSAGARALEATLALAGIAGLQYLVHLMLRPTDVVPLDLVGGSRPGKRIGWDARLGVDASRPADVRYPLRPL